MPRFGIGAWEMTSDTIPALRSAVESVGYVHIDTAQYYRNESSVGQYARESSVGREKLFITTKTFTKGKGAKESIERSLEKAGLEYWDLVLIHAPDGGKKARAETWEALSGLVEEGKVRRLGVSNYGEKHIKELLDSKPKVLPVVNQVSIARWHMTATVTLREHANADPVIVLLASLRSDRMPPLLRASPPPQVLRVPRHRNPSVLPPRSPTIRFGPHSPILGPIQGQVRRADHAALVYPVWPCAAAQEQ